MAVAFYKVAEEIEALDLEEKIYLKDILEKQVCEERRKEIRRHSEESLKEYEEGKIRFGRIEDMKEELYGD